MSVTPPLLPKTEPNNALDLLSFAFISIHSTDKSKIAVLHEFPIPKQTNSTSAFKDGSHVLNTC